MPTPGAQCLGGDRFQLAVVPVGADDLRAGSTLPELWEEVFLPPLALWLRQATALRPPGLDVRLEGSGLVLSAVKPGAAGGLVLRCYNAGAESVEGSWQLGRAAARAELVRADERGARALALADGGRSIPFRAGPRAIVTVLVDGPP
jgi:hypothetical protein